MSSPDLNSRSLAASRVLPGVAALCIAFALGAPRIQAQAQSPSQPQPQVQGNTQGQQSPNGASQTVANPPAPAQPQLNPDTNPLAGAFLYTLGSIPERHNFLQTAFSIGEMGVTNADYVSNGAQSFTTATVPEASLDLVSRSQRNSFSAGYLGGGYIYNSNLGSSSSFHSADVSDEILFRRLTLSFSDSFSYLPESAFGFGSFGGLGGVGSFGGGMAGINPTYMPNQSILTSLVGTFSNTALVQAEYALSARTSFTAVGNYGILHSLHRVTGFFSGNMAGGSAGIQHALTPRDDIGVSYQYNTFRYTALNNMFSSNSVDFDYGRKITGELALQLSGGPELIRNRIQGIIHSQVVGAGFGNLDYSRGRNRFDLSGGRFASSGSGIFQGADTEELSGSWSRQIARRISSSVNGGVSHNTALIGAITAFHYTYGYGGVVLNWALSRYVALYVNYQYERQIANVGACSTQVCAGRLARQIVGVGLTFKPRPFGL